MLRRVFRRHRVDIHSADGILDHRGRRAFSVVVTAARMHVSGMSAGRSDGALWDGGEVTRGIGDELCTAARAAEVVWPSYSALAFADAGSTLIPQTGSTALAGAAAFKS